MVAKCVLQKVDEVKVQFSETSWLPSSSYLKVATVCATGLLRLHLSCGFIVGCFFLYSNNSPHGLSGWHCFNITLAVDIVGCCGIGSVVNDPCQDPSLGLAWGP
jgi:hypothetical protein